MYLLCGMWYILRVVKCTKAIMRVTFKTQRFCPYAFCILYIFLGYIIDYTLKL